MKTVFDEMTGEDPAWLVYKLKSHQLSLQELAALGRRVRPSGRPLGAMRVYTQPLKPISDFGDTINGVKLELELTGAFKRENRFWSAIKRVLNVG